MEMVRALGRENFISFLNGIFFNPSSSFEQSLSVPPIDALQFWSDFDAL